MLTSKKLGKKAHFNILLPITLPFTKPLELSQTASSDNEIDFCLTSGPGTFHTEKDFLVYKLYSVLIMDVMLFNIYV